MHPSISVFIKELLLLVVSRTKFNCNVLASLRKKLRRIYIIIFVVVVTEMMEYTSWKTFCTIPLASLRSEEVI